MFSANVVSAARAHVRSRCAVQRTRVDASSLSFAWVRSFSEFSDTSSEVLTATAWEEPSSGPDASQDRLPAKANHSMREFVNYPDAFVYKNKRNRAMSAMEREKLRKKARIQGNVFRGAKLEEGGWDPAWDAKRFRMLPMRPPKGTKRERTVRQRVDKIEKAMEGMAERIQEYVDEVDKGQPLGSFETELLANSLLKKLAAEEAEAAKLAKKAAKRKARQNAKK